jgi:hypothetical protein
MVGDRPIRTFRHRPPFSGTSILLVDLYCAALLKLDALLSRLPQSDTLVGPWSADRHGAHYPDLGSRGTAARCHSGAEIKSR